MRWEMRVIQCLSMQVALNDESEYEGGRLVYATDEGLLCPSRTAGSATLHDNTIAHGVSLHTRGVRYSLFFLQAPASTGSEHERGSQGG
jgi:predicted 2-oxoglutarate/Fe(II)-dependent dioxygenase YbiX